MFNFAKRCPIQLKDVWFKRCGNKRWGNKRWGSGNGFAKQEVQWCHYVPRLFANLIRENKMVSAAAAINVASRYIEVFQGIKHYYNESTATTKCHGYSVWFFRLLCSQTGGIWRNFNCSNYEKFEESYAQEINFIGYLH